MRRFFSRPDGMTFAVLASGKVSADGTASSPPPHQFFRRLQPASCGFENLEI
jgi:hypothetical protein